MQLHHLPLKRARHHPLAQAFEAVHLGLHQTSAVIAAPLFPDAAPQSVTGSQRFVARMRSHQGRLPRLGVLARGDHRLRISLGNRRMARLGVVGTVPTDAGNRLIGWYLLQQLEQHGRIAHAVVGHLDGPDLQRVGINTQVHLAPLAPVLGTVLLAFPFAFAKELNAGAVHQQFQCGGTGSVGQLYLQSLLASAHGAVVGHPPVQACQTQQAFNHAQALTQGQTEQALDAQTELDGCVGEDVLAPAFAAGWGVPLHAFVQPDCQRPSGFERGVVLCPVGGLVAGLGPLRFTHVSRLPAQRTGFVQQSLPEAERIYGKETIAGWRGTVGTQILAGAPLDENINSWINGFGDKKIEKFHLSQSTASNGDVSYSGNWQEHVGKAMVATELSSKLRNEDPYIKYLFIPTGAKDLYFLRKEYDHIGDVYPSFIRATESNNRIKDNSRVLLAAKEIAKGHEPQANYGQANTVADRFKDELAQEYADQDDLPMDNEPIEKPQYDNERILNLKFAKEYDITPTHEEQEDSLEGDIVKDKAVELLADSHAINVVRQLLELMLSKKSKTITTNPYEKTAFENKKKYSNSYTGLELKREKEKH